MRQQYGWPPQPEVLISPEGMADIIKIPTWFSTTASSNKASLGDSNNDRQPEMPAETGNIYISETRDTIEIPTANSGLSTMAS